MKKIKRPAASTTPLTHNNHHHHHSTTRSPPLDLSTVPTASYASETTTTQPQLQQLQQPPPLPQRAFNLPEAPTFRPTKDEFRDPLAYIQKIRPEAEKAGICKIIPPEGWNPSFALDTETFRFETRVQKLNSMEGETRTNLNYLEQLYKWHRQAGHPVTRIPMLDKKPIDLFRLKKEVTARGGFEKVTQGKKWAEIGRVLKLDRKTCTSLSNSLKQAYMKICLPYEQFLEKQSRLSEQIFKAAECSGPSAATGPSEVTRPSEASTCERSEPRCEGSEQRPIEATGPSEAQPCEQSEPLCERSEQCPNEARSFERSEPYCEEGARTCEQGENLARVDGDTPIQPQPNTPTPSSLVGVPGVPGLSSISTPPTLSPARRSTRARKSTFPGDGSPHSFSSHENTPAPNLPAASSLSPSRPPTPKRNLLSEKSTPNADTLTPSKQHKRQKITPEKSKIVSSSSSSMYKEVDTEDSDSDSEVVLPEVCEVCHEGTNPDQMLLCDGCDKGYHIYCLIPPLASIPKSEWYCTQCLVQSGDDYGFEEGEEYSLYAFQKKADDFKQQWFSMYPDAVGVGPNGESKGGEKFERIVEKEFWRLVESPHAACEVEYGADLHSTVHGSGFPTVEKYPTDPYSTHGWNLNIMPVLRDSLFSHIKSDISGMMIPWLYVGMCFSTFCWHNEDHYTYSINYMHWGETKTWYGIPSSNAEKFEEAMKNAVPELFESNPDLLFQLVTMLSPGRLISSGVDVVALDQRPGQFVITFPKAYHAGFNHGFNFAEAVNFAPSDWEPYGLACAQRYQQYRKMPVFSHDELLVTTFQNDNSIRTAVWLKEALSRRRDQEIELRNKVRNAHGRTRPGSLENAASSHTLNEVVEIGDRPDDQARCAYCHVYCYFSAISCSCSATKFMCLNHEDELCRCDPAKHTLHVRFNDSQLDQIVRQVSDRAAAPTLWVEKLEKTMTTAALAKKPPSLKSLRGLLAEADGIPHPLDQVGSLKVFVDRANAWVDKVGKLVVRKQHANRISSEKKRNKPSKKSSSSSSHSSTKQRNAKLEDVINLLEEAEILHFDSPEVRLLRELWRAVSTFRVEARRVLEEAAKARERKREKENLGKEINMPEYTKIETLREIGNGLNVEMEEMKELDLLIRELEWRRRAKRKLEVATKGGGFGAVEAVSETKTKLEEKGDSEQVCENAEELIRQAITMGIPIDDELVSKLVEARDEGIRLEKKLTRILKLDSAVPNSSAPPAPLGSSSSSMKDPVPETADSTKMVVEGEKKPEDEETVTLESLRAVLDQAWKTAASDRVLTKAQATYNRAAALSRQAKSLLDRAEAAAAAGTPNGTEPGKLGEDETKGTPTTTPSTKRSRVSSSHGSSNHPKATLVRKPTYSDLEHLLRSEDTRHFLTLLQIPELDRLKEEATVCEKWSTKGRRMFGRMGGASKPLLALLEETEGNVEVCTVEEEIRKNEGEEEEGVGPRKYCLCRKEESGFMLECPICKEWYHGTCVKVNRKQANALSRYTCPICDVTQTIPRTGHRPRLTDLESLLQEGRKMRFEPDELTNLKKVVLICSRFRETIQRYLARPEFDAGESNGIKHYLRKLEGMEIHLADETRRLRDLVLNHCPIPPDPSEKKERKTKAVTERLNQVEKEYSKLLKDRIEMFDALEKEQDEADGVFLARSQEVVRCVCDRQDLTESGYSFFVACDRCNMWSHGSCVGVDEEKNVEEWFCASCTYKKARRSELLTKHYADLERAKKRAAAAALASLETEEAEEKAEAEREAEREKEREAEREKEGGGKKKKRRIGDDGNKKRKKSSSQDDGDENSETSSKKSHKKHHQASTADVEERKKKSDDSTVPSTEPIPKPYTHADPEIQDETTLTLDEDESMTNFMTLGFEDEDGL